jgi:hypothetical protein
MNKFLFKILLTCLLYVLYPQVSQAETAVEFRTAAFIPTNKLFREIYGHVGASYQLEASTDMWGCLQGWVNLEFFPKTGHVKHCGKSKLDIYNFSFGPKYLLPLTQQTEAYAGFGLNMSTICIRNRGCDDHRTSKFAFGGVLKSGIHIYLPNNMLLDLFCDYLYQRVHFQKNVNIGGFKTGVGIGVRF